MEAAGLLQEFEAKISALERLVGRQALEIEFLKGALKSAPRPQKRDYVRDCRPRGLTIARGCRLMGLPRSTYYDTPATEADTEIVARITAICEEFEAYGYRRVGAELRHQGIVVNGKKIRRLMRQHDLQPKRRRRFIATTDSDHDSPIFSNRAKDVTADRPNQLWVQTSPTSRSPLASFMPPSSSMRGHAASLVMPSAARSIRGSPWQRSRPLSGHDSRQGAVSTIRIAIIPAIRSGRLSQAARQTWADRLDEPAWQPLRERYG